ncbi:MAG TPA: hypothetical protein VFA74_13530 [Terriglobales bacterium]|nr:hypothetical protein [Terriglobales bacterium]
MHDASESRLSRGIGKTLFLAVAVVCISLVTSLSTLAVEKANSPKYDLQSETKMKGIVDEVKLPPKGSEKDAAHVMIKSGTDMIDVYLCPKSFLDDMGVSLSKGDEIALTGSKVKAEGADLILARELVKGNDTVVLRDDKGNPVWSWRR